MLIKRENTHDCKSDSHASALIYTFTNNNNIINFSKPPVHWVGLPLNSGQVERGLVEVKI